MEIDLRKALIFACVIIIVALIFIKLSGIELFESKREKAEAIGGWYDQKGQAASYEKFRKDLPNVDIVDYERTKNLADKSPTSIEQVIV